MIYLRSTLFFIGMVVSAPLITLFGLLVSPLPFTVRYRVISQWAFFVIWWLKVTCKLDYKVSGLEHLNSIEAGILLSKHQSAWETMAFQSIFPPQVWVLKRSLLWVPFFGWGLALLKPIAIDRGAGRKALQQVIDQGIERLQSGIWVVIFPEGTRLAPGKKKKFAAGGAMLANKSGYPAIPVAHNAGSFWARRGLLKRPGVIEVRIGAPIYPEGRSSSEINQLAEDWIDTQMAEIESL
ncbi:MAG: 1-acyl-sn-glycerol-3-phosphate acyltransferase [Gammaproteobacteria bacterium]|jgi:1-acyl-sn-glycerol-3-phosphate acyltransferase|nr:1-acyl-sn-glycerol-3-phosphate acyltransferase [Gammaproteobacteria bacterium]MBT3490435.1 1-acyl-sn-glycerol-3-phosphate acyltransferase [Gammaproteobacteria bacterium]MBT3718907.1 1-acyl-sn-glycerol-3-phosphate acyltransferase [Gammaproteobacteria bacterium]MBT3845246.1 1-acyl-sn-glycerol-3-phosphate acyltransferase [Gammaproteobacteria bacterium]MBT3893907.1 1-acyl-sn-glycerol-3-phosphate acyltransferase [Gammaproteobacteria bacterium]